MRIVFVSFVIHIFYIKRMIVLCNTSMAATMITVHFDPVVITLWQDFFNWSVSLSKVMMRVFTSVEFRVVLYRYWMRLILMVLWMKMKMSDLLIMFVTVVFLLVVVHELVHDLGMLVVRLALDPA